jgi:sigma-B regulation protein RsbU (phosphoserine phosphatase)
MKSMILSLSPGRRLLLLLSIILTWLSGTYTLGRYTFDMGFGKWGFVIILIVLMLELKDKLLAREELETGRAIQLALLPEDNPSLPGWEIWLFSRTANEVGGDLVDYIRLSHKRLGLALGDVSGKGLGAALLMAKLQATLRALVTDLMSLAELGLRTNQIFCRDGISGRFATLLYLEIRPDSGHIRLLNAGHMPPMVLRAGIIEEIQPSGLPVGTVPEATYEEQALDLEPGDLLINYTDGLTEACDARGRFFGEVGLSDLIHTLRGLSAEEAGSRIVSAVEAFIGNERPSDDLALIVLRRVR